ncbi:Uncharacterised protein [Mycobacteroides abscessus subsp. abscessus]|nr:Uncharacterised protein [Mycobacteroides abscessus subsp. abscessus]
MSPEGGSRCGCDVGESSICVMACGRRAAVVRRTIGSVVSDRQVKNCDDPKCGHAQSALRSAQSTRGGAQSAGGTPARLYGAPSRLYGAPTGRGCARGRGEGAVQLVTRLLCPEVGIWKKNHYGHIRPISHICNRPRWGESDQLRAGGADSRETPTVESVRLPGASGESTSSNIVCGRLCRCPCAAGGRGHRGRRLLCAIRHRSRGRPRGGPDRTRARSRPRHGPVGCVRVRQEGLVVVEDPAALLRRDDAEQGRPA